MARLLVSLRGRELGNRSAQDVLAKDFSDLVYPLGQVAGVGFLESKDLGKPIAFWDCREYK